MGPCVCCVCGSRTGAGAEKRLTITATDDADVAQNGNSKRGQLSSSSSVSNATANSRPAVDPDNRLGARAELGPGSSRVVLWRRSRGYSDIMSNRIPHTRCRF